MSPGRTGGGASWVLHDGVDVRLCSPPLSLPRSVASCSGREKPSTQLCRCSRVSCLRAQEVRYMKTTRLRRASEGQSTATTTATNSHDDALPHSQQAAISERVEVRRRQGSFCRPSSARTRWSARTCASLRLKEFHKRSAAASSRSPHRSNHRIVAQQVSQGASGHSQLCRIKWPALRRTSAFPGLSVDC